MQHAIAANLAHSRNIARTYKASMALYGWKIHHERYFLSMFPATGDPSPATKGDTLHLSILKNYTGIINHSRHHRLGARSFIFRPRDLTKAGDDRPRQRAPAASGERGPRSRPLMVRAVSPFFWYFFFFFFYFSLLFIFCHLYFHCDLVLFIKIVVCISLHDCMCVSVFVCVCVTEFICLWFPQKEKMKLLVNLLFSSPSFW